MLLIIGVQRIMMGVNTIGVWFQGLYSIYY